VFTTHKTLCGPRGAVILTTDEERAAKVDNAVFPGEQGGPHVNKFVALAVAFKLAQTPEFKALQRQIVANANALAASLQTRGVRLAYGGTDTHLLLADLRSVKSPTGYPLRGEVAARLLEICGIVVNKNTIPGDDVTSLASGIRLGTPWVTQRGMREPEMDQIADLIHRVVSDVRPFAYAGLGGELPRGKATLAVLRQVSQEVDELTARFDPQPPRRSAYPHYPLLPDGDSPTPWTADDEKAVAAALKAASLQGTSEGTALLVRGLRAAAFLQEVGTANLATLQPGHAAQIAILDAGGTVMDDLIVARLAQNARGEDRYCVIANAPNAARIKEWFRALSDGYVVFDNEDIFRKVQGPVVVEDVPAEHAKTILRRKASVAPQRSEGASAISGLALYNGGHEALFDLGKPYFVGQTSLAPSAPVDALPEFAWHPEESALKRTPLYDEHKKRTRKLIPFAGWEMPVWYTSVGEEHTAVRNAAGLFDVAHMGVLDVSGPSAASFLDAVSSNYARWLDPGQSQYGYLLDPDANVIDDIMIYCLRRDRYLVVINAANADKDWAWLNAVNEGRVQIDRKRPYVKMDAPAVLRDLKDPRWGADCRVDLALQGPASLSILQTLVKDPRRAAELARIRRTDLLETELAGMPIVVSRTGYTGELVGFELFVHPDNAVRLWNLLLEKGEPFGIQPAGLAARDSTRIEAGLPLYGHELAGDYNVSPIEAGFAAYVKYHKPFFVGREAIMARAQASNLSVVRFRANSSTARAFRGHEPVVNKRGQYIGRVTSCTLVEDAQVGMALVDKRYATPGTEVAIYPTASAKGDKPVVFAEMSKGDQALLPEWCTVLPRFRGAESSVPATAGE
jgi:glycine hydroxymethyltransferase